MQPGLLDDARRAHDEVRGGALRRAALRARLSAVPFVERDVWVDVVLGVGDVDDDVDLPPGAVPYLPCGVDAIVAAIDAAPVGKDDVFVDFGAGVGRVCALVHLLTGARCVGVELQPHLVDAARALAADLGVAHDVEFVCGDAGVVDVRGSVEFVYASFGPPTLSRVLQRLRGRDAVFCAVGFDVDVPWLSPLTNSSPSPEVALYRARRVTTSR